MNGLDLELRLSEATPDDPFPAPQERVVTVAYCDQIHLFKPEQLECARTTARVARNSGLHTEVMSMPPVVWDDFLLTMPAGLSVTDHRN